MTQQAPNNSEANNSHVEPLAKSFLDHEEDIQVGNTRYSFINSKYHIANFYNHRGEAIQASISNMRFEGLITREMRCKASVNRLFIGDQHRDFITTEFVATEGTKFPRDQMLMIPSLFGELINLLQRPEDDSRLPVVFLNYSNLNFDIGNPFSFIYYYVTHPKPTEKLDFPDAHYKVVLTKSSLDFPLINSFAKGFKSTYKPSTITVESSYHKINILDYTVKEILSGIKPENALLAKGLVQEALGMGSEH